MLAGVPNGGNPLVSVVPHLAASMVQTSPFASYTNIVTIVMQMTNYDLREADGGVITFMGLTGLAYVLFTSRTT
jgi:hypothetical protein